VYLKLSHDPRDLEKNPQLSFVINLNCDNKYLLIFDKKTKIIVTIPTRKRYIG